MHKARARYMAVQVPYAKLNALKNGFAALLVGILSMLSCLCAAQPAQQGGQSDRDDPCLQDSKCAELFDSARSLSQAGQYAAALVAYQSAYGRKSVAWLLVNIGRMQQKTGRTQQAIATYQRYLATPDAANDVELQQKTRQYLLSAEQEASAVKPGMTSPAAEESSAPRVSERSPIAKSSPSSTRSPSADACLQDNQCADLCDRAYSLSQLEQYEAALVTYQSAYVRKPVAWLLVNIGRMQQRMGQPQQAMSTYERFLAAPDAAADTELREKALRYLKAAQAEVAMQRSPPVAQQPIYKKWWLWVVVGGAAVAAGAIATATGLVLSNPTVIPNGTPGYYHIHF